ncbi:MAG: hypothetical protein LUD72_12120, partial [Bacteroidales bacterium]|nr:hypothetical protein [Bacteroidales bacterium]
ILMVEGRKKAVLEGKMAEDLSKRGHIRTELYKFLSEREMMGPVYKYQVEQYLTFFDRWKNLDEMAKKNFGHPDCEKIYIAASSEARQVQKSMQGILDFIGFTPKSLPPKEENIDL